MPRLPILFGTTAVVVLVAGLISSRFQFSTGMTLALPRNTYFIPYHLLCFGAASCFCLFAFLYSMWMVPWSASAGLWHFGISVVLLALFCGAAVAMESAKAAYGSSPAAVTLLLAFIVSPLLFAIVHPRWIEAVLASASRMRKPLQDPVVGNIGGSRVDTRVLV